MHYKYTVETTRVATKNGSMNRLMLFGVCHTKIEQMLVFVFRLWENSKHVSKQLDKIGLMLSTTLVNAGLTSFSKLQASRPRQLEMVSTVLTDRRLKGFISALIQS